MKRLRVPVAIVITFVAIAVSYQGQGYVIAATAPASTSSLNQAAPSPVRTSLPFPTSSNPGSSQSSTSTLSQAVPDANSCFAYYGFGSVQTVIQSQTPVTTVGVPLQLNAVITNNNDYPIINGAVYVKVFKNRPDGDTINGPAVVDEFFATDTVDLAAHATTSLNFAYNIPAYAESGDYQIGTYFTASKKFNLSGLSFTDDVVGSQWDFSIKGGYPSVVEFDKDKVTVASSTYYFASYPPTVPQNEPITVNAPIVNATDNPEIVNVSWVAYSWDSQLDSNIVATSTSQVYVAAHGTGNADFTLLDNSHPVYLVVGTLSYRDTKSVINVRFVRSGIDQARLNFPAVTSFPLVSGQPTTLFSCLYNSGLSSLIPPHTIDLSLVDPSGNVFENYSITEPVTGAMMLAKTVFTPKASYDDFTLKATLKDIHGNIVDQVNIPYDCKAIDPASCLKHGNAVSETILILLILIALVIIAGGAWIAVRRNRPRHTKRK